MLRLATFLLVLAALAGCSNDAEKIQAQVTTFKSELDPEMQLLTRHSKFLKKKAETIAAKVDKLEADQAQLVSVLYALTSHPEAVKRDMTALLEAQQDTMATFQRATLQEFGRFLDQRDAAVQQKLAAQSDSLNAELAKADEFVRFVFSYQDTVNHNVAARFDQKPWYTSILGRWEAQRPKK